MYILRRRIGDIWIETLKTTNTMNTSFREKLTSKLIIYLDQLAPQHPNLASRVLQESMAKEIVNLADESSNEVAEDILGSLKAKTEGGIPRRASNLTEEDLINLDFSRENVSPEESGDAYDYHYYVRTFGNPLYGLTLMSNPSDEAVKEGWKVHIFDYKDFIFDDVYQVIDLVEALGAGLIR